MDARSPRDGKAIEEVGTYDPMVRETDKRCTMKADRVDYWLGVGAEPTKKVMRLIEKYKGKVADLRVDQPRQVSIPEARPILAAPRPTPEEEAAAEDASDDVDVGAEPQAAEPDDVASPETEETEQT
jgi:small subunit ribosomal protein S16